jgi:putative ATP-binding cassette transporter
MDKTYRQFLRDLWQLIVPYWVSEERWQARGLLALIIAMVLGQVYVNVLFNEWNNLFYNALQDRKFDEFLHQLGRFCILAAVSIVNQVYRVYLRQMLQIRWRSWLTRQYAGDWLAGRNYYRLQLADYGTDNPDQRISEDLKDFVEKTLLLGLGFIGNAVTLVSFLSILWSLSGALAIPLGAFVITVPGYMVWVALVYSALGTWLTHKIGRPLVLLNFQQQHYEADFRFSLVRVRENAESIALYRGEASEQQSLRERFAYIVTNWWGIMRRQRTLTWFTAGFSQVADVFPFLVAAPRYFSGAIQLGGLMQTASAFGQVQGAMSWFIDSYVGIAAWKATVDRLTSFHNAMRTIAAEDAEGTRITVQRSSGAPVTATGLTLEVPDGRVLMTHADFAFEPGVSTYVSGPSGAGKSTLFRAIAGIWPYGFGHLTVPDDAEIFFLPQKPYLPIGSLRRAVSYPSPEGEVDDEAIRQALRDSLLPQLVVRLDEQGHWAQMLSPGEQQRVAIARALLQAPAWLFLDEATSALDEETETAIYRLLRDKLPGTTIVSIAHRPAIADFHRRRIELRRNGAGPAQLMEAA